jgi:DDE superfamily endonuclease
MVFLPQHDELSNAEILILGLALCGFSNKRVERTHELMCLERFKDSYYACPQTVRDVYRDIQNPLLAGCKHIVKPNPSYLLLALRFLKKYPSKYDLAGMGGCTEKTALERVWSYMGAIQAIKEHKIKWIFDDIDTYPEMYVASVDGVHCQIMEPRKIPSSKWYSKKFNKAGLTYEIGVAIYHDKIVWINGPFPAGENDKKVFDKPEGLANKLKEGQQVIGDEGYRGRPDKASTRNAFDGQEVKDYKRRVKARHETVNSRLKAFGILDQKFRTTGNSRLTKHKAAFEACCVIIQYEMENGSPLFKV